MGIFWQKWQFGPLPSFLKSDFNFFFSIVPPLKSVLDTPLTLSPTHKQGAIHFGSSIHFGALSPQLVPVLCFSHNSSRPAIPAFPEKLIIYRSPSNPEYTR